MLIRHDKASAIVWHAIFTPFWYHWGFYSFIPLIKNPGRFQWEFESTKLLWGECVGINLPETSIFNFIEYALSISISHHFVGEFINLRIRFRNNWISLVDIFSDALIQRPVCLLPDEWKKIHFFILFKLFMRVHDIVVFGHHYFFN